MKIITGQVFSKSLEASGNTRPQASDFCLFVCSDLFVCFLAFVYCCLSNMSSSLHVVDQFDVSVLQESLHLSGVGAMGRKDQVPVSQLHSAVVEMYSCLRVQKPVLGVAKLHQAQELCSNWLQMNYQCSTGGKVEAGSLKVTLCLLSGSKEAEKARCKWYGRELASWGQRQQGGREGSL